MSGRDQPTVTTSSYQPARRGWNPIVGYLCWNCGVAVVASAEDDPKDELCPSCRPQTVHIPEHRISDEQLDAILAHFPCELCGGSPCREGCKVDRPRRDSEKRGFSRNWYGRELTRLIHANEYGRNEYP